MYTTKIKIENNDLGLYTNNILTIYKLTLFKKLIYRNFLIKILKSRIVIRQRLYWYFVKEDFRVSFKISYILIFQKWSYVYYEVDEKFQYFEYTACCRIVKLN